jgi:hypothetical protein
MYKCICMYGCVVVYVCTYMYVNVCVFCVDIMFIWLNLKLKYIVVLLLVN